MLSLYAEEQETKDREKISKADERRKLLENEEIFQKDMYMRSLIRLVRFRKDQLNQYYDAATDQMRRSFLYSTFAMWAGFLIILFVILQSLVPPSWGLPSPRAGINYLLTTTGVLVEVVSALLFWVYRTAKAEQRYYYARRIYLHSVLLGFEISQSMKDSADSAKQKLVEHLLEGALHELPGLTLPSGVELAKLAHDTAEK